MSIRRNERSRTIENELIQQLKYTKVMKKFYLKPEARFVNINVSNPMLDEDPAVSENGNVSRVWEEGNEVLPKAHSVWGEEEVEE